MEAPKYKGVHSKEQPHHSFIQGDSNHMDSDKNKLEVAYDRGLAGLREYLNQLTPEQRSQLMSAISKNINRTH